MAGASMRAMRHPAKYSPGGRAEQWLAEGMAEWVAFSTLERLG